MPVSEPIAIVFHGDPNAADKRSLTDLVTKLLRGIERDASITRDSTGGAVAKLIASAVVGGTVAARFESLTPLKWAARGFGPLPFEFTKTGAIQVFELSFMQRAIRVALPAAGKAVAVFFVFNGGVYAGAVINQFLSEQTKDAIGGTINEIINEGGWKDLWRNPFGMRR